MKKNVGNLEDEEGGMLSSTFWFILSTCLSIMGTLPKVLGIAGDLLFFRHTTPSKKEWRDNVSEIEELIQQIEELRLNMIKIKEGKSYLDPEVVAASQELDAVLDKYQVMLMEKVDKD